MLLDDLQDLDATMDVFWTKRSSKEQYLAQPHAYIYGIAVSPGTGRRGVATDLLRVVEEQAPERGASHLFSSVVTSPITNMPSMLFHEKHGFERWAVLQPCKLFDMDEYQSVLYAKNLA